MRKKRNIKIVSVLLAVAILAGAGIGFYLNNRQIPESEIMTIQSETDPIATKPEEVYELVDCVFIGELGKSLTNYAEAFGGIPRTISRVKVVEVLKGDLLTEVNVSYRGGIITYQEYIAAQRSDEVREYMEEDYKNNPETRKINYVRWEPRVKVEKGVQYLFFTFHPKKNDFDPKEYGFTEDNDYNEYYFSDYYDGNYYIVANEMYSMLKITDDGKQVYRADAEKYEELDRVISRMKAAAK